MAGARHGIFKLTARHGRGKAWAWHAMCESAFTETNSRTVYRNRAKILATRCPDPKFHKQTMHSSVVRPPPDRQPTAGMCGIPKCCPQQIHQQGRIKLFGAPRQWKHFRPLFQAAFLSWGGYYPPVWVKHHASQSQDRNNKYFILYIEFCINNKI